MTTEKQNTEAGRTADWKAEARKYWQQIHGIAGHYYDAHRQRPGKRRLAACVLGLAGTIWLASGCYIVPDGSRGVLSGPGAVRVVGAGWHWHLPAPLAGVELIDVSSERQVEIGYRQAGRYVKAMDVPEEALLLTKDGNLLDVRLAVQYRIVAAGDFIDNVGKIDAVLRDIVESRTYAAFARRDMQAAVGSGRGEMTREIQQGVEAAAARYRMGIAVTAVKLQEVQVPEALRAVSDDVVRAAEERRRSSDQAAAYAADILPKARAEAGRLRQQAEAYSQEQIALAQGESARFVQLLEAYRKHPASTRSHLLQQARQTALSSSKIVLEGQAMPQLQLMVPAAGSATPPVQPAQAGPAPGAEPNRDLRPAVVKELRPSRSRS